MKPTDRINQIAEKIRESYGPAAKLTDDMRLLAHELYFDEQYARTQESAADLRKDALVPAASLRPEQPKAAPAWNGSHPPPPAKPQGIRTTPEIRAELLICAASWEPGVRLLGNVRADELAALLRFDEWMSKKLAACGPLVNAVLRFEKRFGATDAHGTYAELLSAARDYRKAFNDEADALAAESPASPAGAQASRDGAEKQTVERGREDCNCEQSRALANELELWRLEMSEALLSAERYQCEFRARNQSAIFPQPLLDLIGEARRFVDNKKTTSGPPSGATQVGPESSGTRPSEEGSGVDASALVDAVMVWLKEPNIDTRQALSVAAARHRRSLDEIGAPETPPAPRVPVGEYPLRTEELGPFVFETRGVQWSARQKYPIASVPDTAYMSAALSRLADALEKRAKEAREMQRILLAAERSLGMHA